MTATLLSVLLSIAALSVRPLPVGTQLHIRLTTTVGSYASAPGSAVSAVLIAPVTLDGETILPAGSTLAGRLKSVTRVGFGVRHETAGLNFEFNQIAPLDADPIPLSARVSQVDNSRERVSADGRIHGVRSTSSMCYRISGYIRTALQWEIHAYLAEWAIRSLLMELPEPEIYYPAGVELTLTLNQPLLLEGPLRSDEAAGRKLSGDEREELGRIVALMPYRTETPISSRSSDLTNLLFVGSRDEITTAFQAAGWTQPSPASFRDRVNWIRAVAELRGDSGAPMSLLLLNGAEPDMSWEKGLNDVSKRHHLRVWKAAGTWQGNEMWIGAATRDVDFAYLRRGSKISHRIEEDIDQERDKVAYDLAFSTCGNPLGWLNRPDFPRSAHNATGDPILTDGRMAAIALNDCRAPRLSTENVDSTPIAEHGGLVQRFARREVLSFRNGLLRTNPYWRSYEAVRWMVDYFRARSLEAKRVRPDAGAATAVVLVRHAQDE
jgi:LssY C-terminus